MIETTVILVFQTRILSVFNSSVDFWLGLKRSILNYLLCNFQDSKDRIPNPKSRGRCQIQGCDFLTNELNLQSSFVATKTTGVCLATNGLRRQD